MPPCEFTPSRKIATAHRVTVEGHKTLKASHLGDQKQCYCQYNAAKASAMAGGKQIPRISLLHKGISCFRVSPEEGLETHGLYVGLDSRSNHIEANRLEIELGGR
jgi:hypothetical protein